MDAPTEALLQTLKDQLFNFDMSEHVARYSNVTGTNNDRAITVGRNFQQYLYLQAKYPSKTIPPSLELDIFGSLVTNDTKYKNMLETATVPLPHYQRYFYQKKYINKQDLYHFRNTTQTLFMQEFETTLQSYNVNIFIRGFRFVNAHFATIITLLIPAILGTMLSAYIAETNRIRETHRSIDEATRLLTYNDEFIYTTCNGPKDFISSNFYYKILFDTKTKLIDSFDQLTILTKRAFNEGLVSKNLLDALVPLGKYNEKIARAGMGVCKLKLKNLDELIETRNKLVATIQTSEKEKQINLLEYLF